MNQIKPFIIIPLNEPKQTFLEEQHWFGLIWFGLVWFGLVWFGFMAYQLL